MSDNNSNLQSLVESIEALSLLDVSKLVKMLEERLGVSAAMPVATVAAAPGAVVAEENEQTEFTVTLVSAGEKKLDVIKEIRTIVSGLGLKEAKDLADQGGIIKSGVSKEEAKKIEESLKKVGATIKLS